MLKRKKLLFFLIILGIALGIGVIPINVQAETEAIEPTTVKYLNPFYKDTLDEECLADPSAVFADDIEQYYLTVEEAGKSLREQMKEKVQIISIGFQTNVLDEQIVYDIFETAVQHTGTPTEGDYLLFQCGGWQCNMSGYISNGTYYLSLSYTVTYFTTTEMENQITAAATLLLTELNLKEANEYEKIKAIYDWICMNVTYDYDGLEDSGNTQKYTAYSALINRTAVCQGYSVLLYRLLLEVGIDNRIISGNDESHSWNIIKLGIRYYNVDSTWDCDFAQAGNGYAYFLKSTEGFTGHTRDELYSTDSFRQKYPMSESDYDFMKNNHPVPEKPYRIVNVVSGPHVYWEAVSGAEKYGVWRSENGVDGVYKWLGNPTVPHFTDINVKSGKTYYYKITAMIEGRHSDMSESVGITYVATPDITHRSNCAAGVRIGWNKIENAAGYAIYRKTGENDWARVKTITGNNTFIWIDSSVKNNNGTTYKYTIRALAGNEQNILSGCRSIGRTMVRLTSRALSSAVENGANALKCTWNTSSQVDGYEVRFMAGNTVYKMVTIGNYKTGIKTITGLSSNTTYKIQVRSYKKIDGIGCFYSAWSVAKNVSI